MIVVRRIGSVELAVDRALDDAAQRLVGGSHGDVDRRLPVGYPASGSSSGPEP